MLNVEMQTYTYIGSTIVQIYYTILADIVRHIFCRLLCWILICPCTLDIHVLSCMLLMRLDAPYFTSLPCLMAFCQVGCSGTATQWVK